MKIHKEGYPTLLIAFIVFCTINSIVYYFFRTFHPYILSLSIVFYIFLISFFRSPDRTIQNADDHTLLSPCDGKVVVIEKVFETEYLEKECLQISIFMSPLNVHINWFPSAAEVVYSKYHPGKYLFAWNPKSSTENERTSVCFKVNGKFIMLRQVAGALARRIVCYAEENKTYQKGEEIGFIKFGSRVDLYLPVDSDIKIKIGDTVTGNETVIAHI